MLKGKKTYVTAVVTIITAVGMYLTQDATAAEAAQMIFTAILSAAIRNGVK